MKFGREKLKNVWFFYKKQIIALLLVLAVGTVMIVQCSANRKKDLMIYFAGPVYFSPEASQRVCEAFETVIGSDLTRGVGLVSTVIGENLTAGATDREKEQYVINYTKEKETMDSFKLRLRLPDTVVCILSPECYAEALKDGESLRALGEVLDVLPDGVRAEDRGIPLSLLDFYKSNSILKNFPENCLLCLKSPSFVRSDSDYDRQVEAFCRIVRFKILT